MCREFRARASERTLSRKQIYTVCAQNPPPGSAIGARLSQPSTTRISIFPAPVNTPHLAFASSQIATIPKRIFCKHKTRSSISVMTKLTNISSFLVAALILLAPVTTAVGTATIKNSSPVPLYYRCVRALDINDHGQIAPGQSKSFAYGPHVSIKMDLEPVTPDKQKVYQFEFTTDRDTVWYNLSGVDGQPMSQYARSLVPSDSSCTAMRCAAGDVTNQCQFTVTANGHPTPCSVHASLLLTIGGR